MDKQIVVNISDNKGNCINKLFNISSDNPDSNKSMGYMIGYIQACKDKGYDITIVSMRL